MTKSLQTNVMSWKLIRTVIGEVLKTPERARRKSTSSGIIVLNGIQVLSFSKDPEGDGIIKLRSRIVRIKWNMFGSDLDRTFV